jgi:hypothetical protein
MPPSRCIRWPERFVAVIQQATSSMNSGHDLVALKIAGGAVIESFNSYCMI